MSKTELNRRLSVIWTNDDDDGFRYVPRAIPGRDIGSGGWDVFDRKENRFVTSKKEILNLTFENCCEKLAN